MNLIRARSEYLGHEEISVIYDNPYLDGLDLRGSNKIPTARSNSAAGEKPSAGNTSTKIEFVGLHGSTEAQAARLVAVREGRRRIFPCIVHVPPLAERQLPRTPCLVEQARRLRPHPMPAPTKCLLIIPDEAIKRLRSLERLDESPFLQRKSFRPYAGGAGSRRRTTNDQPISRRKREASSTAATVGPETPFQANASGFTSGSSSAGTGQGRRPRELPWLVTPPPSMNHPAAIAAAVAGSQPRRSRPSTTPNIASSAPENVGGKGEQSWGTSAASTAAGNQRDRRQRGTKNEKTGEDSAKLGEAGRGSQGDASGKPVSRPLFPGGEQRISVDVEPSGSLCDDQEAEDMYHAEAEAAAAAQEASDWARRRHEALVCAGSMEVPVGSSSSAAAGSGGTSAGAEFSPVLLLGLGPSSVGGESLSHHGHGAEGGGARGGRSPPYGRGKGRAVHREQATGALPSIPPPPPGSSTTAGSVIVKAVAGRSSATSKVASAIPMDGLEAGLLDLRPFRFGGGIPGDHGSPSSPPSPPSPRSGLPLSASSAASPLSSRSDSEGPEHDKTLGEEGDILGNIRGKLEKLQVSEGGVAVDDRIERKGRDDRPAAAAAREEEEKTAWDRSPGPPEEASEEGLVAARRDTGGRMVAASPDRGDRGELLVGSPGSRSRRGHGWVRGSPRKPPSRAAGSRRSGSRAGRRSPSATKVGCWVPPPTRWGGTPIKSPEFWEGWGESGGVAGHAGPGLARVGTGDSCESRGGRQFPSKGDRSGLVVDWYGDGEEEECEHEEREDTEEDEDEGDFEPMREFFRTADGRSLFAEGVGSTRGGCGGNKRTRREIRWGEDGSDRGRGLLCLLGEEGRPASKRGSPEAKRLGVAARRRRTRIDARSRDGKRRAETLWARETIKRLEDECVSRRTDKLEWRANLAKSRGEAGVQVEGDRAKALLWVVALASGARAAQHLLAEAKGQWVARRQYLQLVASALQVQKAWRSYRAGAPARAAGTKTRQMKDHIEAINRIASKFIICKRARVLVLLKLWPEGELAVKLEMRTGKRIRGDANWRAAFHRRSSRPESPQGITIPLGSTHGTTGGSAAHVGSAAVAAAAPAAAAAHVPPTWFPRLVKQMESRRNETAQNLIKTQGKLFRHRRANEPTWMSMTPVGRAYQEGNMRSHQHQQQLLQRYTGHNQRPGMSDDGGFASGGDSASIAGSSASGKTEGTASTSGTTGGSERATREHNGSRQQRQKDRPRGSHAATAEHSDDDDTQASLSSSVVSSIAERSSADGGAARGKESNAKKKREREIRKGGDGGRRGSSEGAEQGRAKRSASISAEKGLGAIFDEPTGHENFGPVAAPVAIGRPLSRTTPAASSSSGQMHHMFASTAGAHQQHHSYQLASHKKSMHIRDLTSTQLLSGSGWLARLAEIDKEIDAAPLVPLSVKLSTISLFVRTEIMNSVQLRSRASQRVHQGEATVTTARALLQNSIEDFVDQVEAANSSKNSDLLQLYSGEARLRFKAEVDKRVRAHVEKGGNRRAPIGVRT